MNGVMSSSGEVVEQVDLLRRHGLQVTAQRLAVMRSVSRRPHATADEVEELVRADIGSVSRQAVYDALGTLADKGLIRRIQPSRSPARYEDRVDDNHHHVVCRSCGITLDVECAVGHRPCLQAAEDHGFVIDEAEVVYWGSCPDCLRAARRSTTTSEKRRENVREVTR
jgi:Fur family transcriptional regulator, stress-responsive regulator